jgi:hypothetical protein
MLTPISLTKNERKLIRKVCKVNLESLRRILTNEVEDEDIPIYCIAWDIDDWELYDSVNADICLFESIRSCPKGLFSLDDDSLSTVKHILFNFFKHPKWRDTKRALRRKLALVENQHLYFSLN